MGKTWDFIREVTEGQERRAPTEIGQRLAIVVLAVPWGLVSLLWLVNVGVVLFHYDVDLYGRIFVIVIYPALISFCFAIGAGILTFVFAGLVSLWRWVFG